MKVLQVNVGTSRTALDLALRYANKIDANIICLTEPPKTWKGRIGCPGWLEHISSNTAILTRRNVKTSHIWTDTSMVGITVGNTKLMSVYCSPNEEIEPHLDRLETHTGGNTPIVLTGDFNCRWPAFSRLKIRKRDREFYEYVMSNDLKIENDGAPTCIHQGRETTNDYTMTKRTTIKNWRVDTEETLSDHQYITFEIHSDTPVVNMQTKKKINEKILKEKLEVVPTLMEYSDQGCTIENANKITKWLSQAVKECTTEVEYKSHTYWWTEELEKQRLQLKNITRKISRSADPNSTKILRNEKRALKQTYRNTIRRTKAEAWKDFINRDRPWGKPYKVVISSPGGRKQGAPTIIKKPDGSTTHTEGETNKVLLETKFPSAPQEEQAITEVHTTKPHKIVEVTTEEMTGIVKKLNNRSAPGLDGINHKTLKMLNKMHPSLLPATINACMRWSTFPNAWKEGKVVLIPKPSGDPLSADSYRPLTMLPTLGKLLEKCMASRISAIAEPTIHARQYGFRKGRSCEDCVLSATKSIEKMRKSSKAMAIISLDIKGAFDHLLWQWILKKMEEIGVPKYLTGLTRSYFCGRKVVLGGEYRTLERGCPQGSVLGPLMWNIGYNYVLTGMDRVWTKSYAYADDTLMLLAAESIEELYHKVQLNIKRVEKDMQKGGLLLNISKTGLMVMSKDRNLVAPPLRISSRTLYPQPEMKYLGVWLDENLTWERHIRRTQEKVMKILPKLMALARNTFGYSTKARRTMIEGTCGAYMRYSCAVFAHRLSTKKVAKYVDRMHRSMVICYGRLYKTVPYLRSTVLCNWVPAKYELAARAIMYSAKKETNLLGDTLLKRPPGSLSLKETWLKLGEEALQKWIEEWQTSEGSNWTKEILPVPGVEIEPCFWLNQGLSGHGAFGSYLYRMKRRSSPTCACGAREESAEHVLKECALYQNGRPAEMDITRPETRRYIKETVMKVWEKEREAIRRGIERR